MHSLDVIENIQCDTLKDIENPVKVIGELLSIASKIADIHLSEANIFYNEKYIEYMAAALLEHSCCANARGADGSDKDANAIEYKSINLNSNGRVKSFQFHWLSANKMKQYRAVKDVYFIVRRNCDILKIYKLPMIKILFDLEDKSTGNKSVHAHKSFSLNEIIKRGAEIVYE